MRTLIRRLNALLRGRDIDRDLSNDMRAHIELEARELMRAEGLDAAEAFRRAAVAFGGVDRYTEAHRDERGVEPLFELARDARYAVRSLARSPAFTISAVLVLALGIGAGAAIFSAVNAVLISRLPYPHDEQLVRIYNANSPTVLWPLSVVDYQAARDQARSFSALGAIVDRDVPVVAGGMQPAETRIAPTTGGLFAALGVRAALGRVLVAADERESAPRVVV